jgi:hypothetical protein
MDDLQDECADARPLFKRAHCLFEQRRRFPLGDRARLGSVEITIETVAQSDRPDVRLWVGDGGAERTSAHEKSGPQDESARGRH